MRRKIISHQKAVAICKQEGLDFRQIKEQGPFLLKTGAKLGYSRFDKKYAVSGYACDGSDVEPYISYQYGIQFKTFDLLAARLASIFLAEYDGETFVIWMPPGYKNTKRWATKAAKIAEGQVVRR